MAEYTKVWGKDVAGATGEVIFEVYGKKDNDYDSWWEGPSHMTNPIGYADCAANDDLTGLFEATDVRGNLFRTDADGASGSLWTLKYVGKGDGDAINTPDFNNVIVLRLSEMYLNRAEAISNGAAIPGASTLGDLNAIRANRGVSPLVSAGSDAIFNERRLELNFEGHLWFDYARTKRGFYNSNIDQNLTADDYRFLLPIPQRELDVNKNLVQNSGY